MNRNALKIIGIVTMLIDHVGLFFLDNFVWFRIIGRISYPIFAFFIAEGMKYTKNRKKYVLTILIFALITQIPYMFLIGFYNLNVLFTFLLAMLSICFIESKVQYWLKTLLLTILFVCIYIPGIFNVVDYGLYGIALILIFYFIKNLSVKYLSAAGVILFMTLVKVLFFGVEFYNFIQLFSILSFVLLILYNGKKGRLNLKYFFYIFYSIQFYIIWIINLIV